jgi:hypothetical protein
LSSYPQKTVFKHVFSSSAVFNPLKEESGNDIAAFLIFHCRQRAGRKIQAMISPFFLFSIAVKEQEGRIKR